MTRGGKVGFAGLTDVGRVRTHNEDSVLLSPPLFAVADGLGGHEAGEVASEMAIEALVENSPRRPDAKALGRAIRTANKAVLDAARHGQGRSGMGTTLTAAIVEGSTIAIAHVGDSRAYLFHGDTLEQITDDHSMVADMVRQGTLTEDQSRVHPNRSIITRALGSDPNMFADTYEVDAEPGDRLLLCSDGLTSMLTDAEIGDVLRTHRDAGSAVRTLIDAANAAGGHDNITVIIVDIAGEPGAATGPIPARRARGWVGLLVWLLALTAVAVIAVSGVYRYAQARAYVIAEDNRVVLYRGLPGSFAGVE
ncbi:MAG: Stp1/IreP family PP2C-type Ser/Thr phosphatase, partial [Coriobacteriia bacterium]|nr:Stp1/IreP family PP2C-type Ser/Thr phosphatase [Coriobacteriia bacterium]